MAEQRSAEVYSIDDFPGFFSGISKSKLPPGALVDWGVTKGSNRTLGIECSNQGELLSSYGFSRVAPFFYDFGGVNSLFYWDTIFGGDYILVGTSDGIYRLSASEILTGGPGNPTHDYFTTQWNKLQFYSSAFELAWKTPSIPHLRRGKFVPYGKYLYYCDGVGYPLRIRGSGYRVEPMGVGSEASVSSSVVSIQSGYYTGTPDFSIGRDYWITWVSELGESPATMESLTYSAPFSGVPIINISWTSSLISSTVVGANVYRSQVDGTTPRFLGFIPRGMSTLVDDKPDDLLGYPIPLNVGYPSVFSTMEVHQDRMFAVTGAGSPYNISCSEPGQPDVWPALNVIPFVSGGRNEEVVELRSISGNLYLFTKTSLYRLLGTDPTNYSFDLVSPRVGCVSRSSMASWSDGVVFLSMDGVYFFNGSRLTSISDALEGLFRRQTSGAQGWDRVVGAVRGDHYFLSYLESDETSFNDSGSARPQSFPNRTLIFNLKNGRVGVSNDLYFLAAAPVRGVESIVLSPDFLAPTTTLQLCLLSDHPSNEYGTPASGIQDAVTLFLSDLNFGSPDLGKVLDSIEVEYEALFEPNCSCTVYRSYPASDAGTTTGETSSITGVVPTGTALFATTWSGSYGLTHLRRAKFHFTMSQGKSFNVGLSFSTYQFEFRFHRITFHYHSERDAWKGSGVVGSY